MAANGKSATVEFDENTVSAQEVAQSMAHTRHMMGPNMQYGGTLLLSVPGVKKSATGKKAVTALKKVKGVTKVTVYPQQQAVAIAFGARGNATTKELIEALEGVGLKGTQYNPAGKAKGTRGRIMNGPNGSMPDHAGMMADQRRGPSATYVSYGCCCGATRRGCGFGR